MNWAGHQQPTFRLQPNQTSYPNPQQLQYLTSQQSTNIASGQFVRPPPPPGMLNSNNYMTNRSVVLNSGTQLPYYGNRGNKNTDHSSSQCRDSKWRDFYANVRKWKVHYASRNENPTPQHEALFRQFPLPPDEENLLQVKLQELQATKEKYKQPETARSNIPQAFKDFANREIHAAESISPQIKEAMVRELDTLMKEKFNDGLWSINWRQEPSRLPKLLAIQKKSDTQNSKNEPRLSQSPDQVSLKVKKRRKRAWEDMSRSNEVSETKTIPPKQPIEVEKKGKKASTKASKRASLLESDCGLDKKAHSHIRHSVEENSEVLSQRAARFSAAANAKINEMSISHDPYAATRQKRDVKAALTRAEMCGYELDLSLFNIKGTATSLEKKYLRLTSAPDPSSVRPLSVLKRSLSMILKRWSHSPDNPNRKKRDSLNKKSTAGSCATYSWVCDQLKAVRQDITVQHIKSDFVVLVYETHARIALQQHDIGEFNQCLTQLLALYGQNFCRTNEPEFASYHVLYLLFIRVKYSHCNSDLASVLANMSPKLRKNTSVKHALAVRYSIEHGMFVNFYRLLKYAPNLSSCFMNLMIDFVRHETLKVAFLSFRKTIPLDALSSRFMHLDLENSSEDKIVWNQWILKNEAVSIGDSLVVNTKESMSSFSGKFEWPVLGGDNVQRVEANNDI